VARENPLYSSGTSDTFLTAWVIHCICVFSFILMYVLLSCQRDDQVSGETNFFYNEIQIVIFLCEGKHPGIWWFVLLKAFQHYFR
jgi:hypothetical protein